MGHMLSYEKETDTIELFWSFDLSPPDVDKKRAGDTIDILTNFDINANKGGSPSMNGRRLLLDSMLSKARDHPDSHWNVYE